MKATKEDKQPKQDDHVLTYWLHRSVNDATIQEQLDALKAIRKIAPWHQAIRRTRRRR